MATSGSFTPPGAPPCYDPEMTRAEALALRASAGLRVDCHVVITDWTQGTTLAGPNLVELHPVSPSDLGQLAIVHTPHDATAWAGVYDIDLGAGTMTELRDSLGNVVKDAVAGGPTLGAFPWGDADFTDNYVEDSGLTGWATQVGTVARNRVVGSTVNLSGKTGGALVDTEITESSVTSGSASLALSRTVIDGSTVTNTGTGALSMVDTQLSASTVTKGLGSTRGLALDRVHVSAAAITQNGTGSANTDSVVTSGVNRARLTFGATGAGTPSSSVTGLVMDAGSVMNVNDHSVAAVVENSTVNNAGTVTLSGAGTLVRSRVAGGATLSSAFAVTGSTLEGPLTKTTTGANTGAAGNAGYDNWI